MKEILTGALLNPAVIRGKSAYEIAVMHGFNGTEEEWIKATTIEADRAKTEANRAASEANNSKSEADRSKSEADRSKSEADRAEKAAEIAEGGKAERNTEIAYTKAVPLSSAPYAKIHKVGAMTRKCTNVFTEDIAYGYWEINGGTGNVYFISMSGILGSREKFAVKPNTTYCVSSKSSWAVWFVDENYKSLGRMPADGWGYPYTTFTTPSTPCYAVFSSWYDGDYQYDIMINEGTEPLPYEPYFAGLRSSTASMIDSMGANLFDKDAAVKGAICDGDGNVYGNASAFYSGAIPVEQGVTYSVAAYNWYNFYTDSKTPSSSNFVGQSASASFVPPSNASFVRLVGDIANLDAVMFNEGETVQPYSPYHHNTLTIPEAVRPKNCINEDVYDYLDFEEWHSVKACAKYNLGEMQWQATIGQTAYYVVLPELCKGVFISNYNGSLPFYFSADLNAFVVDNDGRSYEEAIALFNGVFVVVELAEPIRSSIYSIFTTNNIPVQGGGKLTFYNYDREPVPSDVTFYTGASEVEGAKLHVGDLLGVAEQAKSIAFQRIEDLPISRDFDWIVRPGAYVIESRMIFGNDGNIGSYTKHDYDELYLICIAGEISVFQMAFFVTHYYEFTPVVAIRSRFDDKWSAWSIVKGPKFDDNPDMMALSDQIEELDARIQRLEDIANIITIGTNVTGRTVKATFRKIATEASDIYSEQVLGFSTGAGLWGDPAGYCYYDNETRSGTSYGDGVNAQVDATEYIYSGGGTVTVYNTEYVKLEYVD